MHTDSFTLIAYGSPIQNKAKILTIYIEGDGFAWRSEEMPSDNPTPIEPIALKMAIHDQSNRPVVYLARPCQFVFNQAWSGCQTAYWTNQRFSPQVIDSTNQAVDALKTYYHAKQIILMGYSGGGAVAALVAAQRKDVVQLTTYSAILDTKQWVRQKSLTPLDGSLNPADAWRNLAAISQTHWVGAQDKVVPKEVAFAFAKRFPEAQKPKIIILPDCDHTQCWITDSMHQ